MQVIDSVNNENLAIRDLDCISSIIMHHTGSEESDERNKDYLNRPDYISAHFLIGKKGQIWQLVDLNRIAMHCGFSAWPFDAPNPKPTKGQSLNWCTVGIEVNSDGYKFSNAQKFAAKELVLYLCDKFKVSHESVFRHKDVAPSRKWDIGENFFNPPHETWGDWQKNLLEDKVDKEKIRWSLIQPWAREAVAAMIDSGVATHWDNPAQITDPATIEQMLYNAGVLTSNSKKGLSKERWAVVFKKLGII